MNQPVEDHLPPYRVRPRFKIEVSEPPEVLMNKIRANVDKQNASCKARIIPGFATLFIPKEEQHYWSPQLTLSIEETENGSLLRGLYGPRDSVWTMFVFFYAAIAFATLIVAVIGFANLSIGKSGAVLWLLPILIFLFFSLYLTAYFGQKMGHDQMVTLHKFVEKSIDLVIL